MNFSYFYHKLLDLVAPPYCVNCMVWTDRHTDVLCSTCVLLVMPLISHKLSLTKTKQMPIFTLSAYAEPLRKLVLAKGRSDRVAATQLGHLIWQLTSLQYQDFDIIVPVPLHWTRYAYRGYNQANVIARVIAQYSGKPVVQLVKRAKRTVQQATLTSAERTANVADVFVLARNADTYTNKKILFVDDLMTTGATLRAVAKKTLLLKPSGMAAVVACRVI